MKSQTIDNHLHQISTSPFGFTLADRHIQLLQETILSSERKDFFVYISHDSSGQAFSRTSSQLIRGDQSAICLSVRA
jgi:hypothetical protein